MRRPSSSAPASPPEPDRLRPYRAKRDFARTPEPGGAAGEGAPTGSAYLVQKHAARRLHFDLRLELDGVLKSWAVPQGPSLDPADRRLAVHVENHPLDYGGFEGTIPQGQYGGGTVMLWDRGSWEPQGDAAAGYAAGKLKFGIKGSKLRGGWTLVRMGGKPKAKDLWLLIKERDEHASEGGRAPDAADRSVLSGRTMAEIAVGPTDQVGAITRREIVPPSAFVPPQLATPADEAPQSQAWLFEVKQDGYRAQIRVHAGDVTVRTRNGHDWTGRFRALASAALPLGSALLDGEVVVLGPDGVSSFALLKQALEDGTDERMLFYAFDLLHLDGEDLRELPLLMRKARLEALLPASPRLRYAEHLIADGPAILRHACRLGAEGVIAKRVDAPYRLGRGGAWLKLKCHLRQEFVVAGYTLPNGHGSGPGALLLGVHQGEALVHVGRVGTGWDAATEATLRTRLDGLRAERPPFARLTKAAARGVLWVRPELVAEVRFQAWTADGLLRHASFQGLREDKDPRCVVREGAVAAPAVADGLELCGVRISNAARRVLDDPPLTKGDIARYYAAVAELIMPQLAGRPVSVVRCPDRLGEGCFYQRHPMPGMPRSVRAAGAEGSPFLAVDTAEGLLALVQFGAIELHANGARVDRPDRPDRLVFDLDPGPEVTWRGVVAAAHELRERLQALRLESFCRTTGGKGLHLVVPLERRHGWPEAKAFAGAVARAMQADSPGRYTAVLAKAARTGRIFVDYLRNDRAATAVASYSLRGRVGAPVSTPLAWAEVTPRLDPRAFTLLTAPDLARKGGDSWAELKHLRQRLPAPGRKP